MTAATIEQRLEALEREVRSLRATVKKKSKKEQPWWERLAGTFKDDPLFDEMVKAGQKYRKSAEAVKRGPILHYFLNRLGDKP